MSDMEIPEVTMGGGLYRNVDLTFARYQNGGIAILLEQDGERLGTASVNMVGNEPSEGCVWIKNWSENEGVLESLVMAGVIERTGRTIQAGYATAYEARLLVGEDDA